MVETLKELVGVIKDLPDLAQWILVGILFYKVFIVGTTMGLAKYTIRLIHDFMTKPKEEIRKVEINSRFITSDGTFDRFLALIEEVRDARSVGRNGSRSNYIHDKDVDWLRSAVAAKRDQDARDASANASGSGSGSGSGVGSI